MKKVMMVVMGMFLLANLSGCGYNMLQAKEEQVKATWGDVESLYQKRADLIGNMAEVVKGYAKHENETLVKVAEARASVGQMKVDVTDAIKMEQFAAKQQTMGTALSRLMMVSEQYPQLKADANFQGLQKQLATTEDEISKARKKYNLSVQVFNSKCRSFPYNVTNSMLLHLELKKPYQAEEGSKVAPKLKF